MPIALFMFNHTIAQARTTRSQRRARLDRGGVMSAVVGRVLAQVKTIDTDAPET